MKVTQVKAVLNWTHVGQYRPYGDTFRECEIHTPDVLEESDILILVNNGRKLPKEEWKKQYDDINAYFRGWYTITKTEYGYKYVGCEPYTD
jgi:hypothetical protein